MNKIIKPLASFLFLLLLWQLYIPKLEAGSPPLKGGKLPEINLPIPKNPNEKEYLGLSGTGFFKIPQIKAKGVMIKIFNLYCPICQAIASEMNEIYQNIENNPDLMGKIKIIGIGTGNSLYEVEVYRKKNNVLYPLFPDTDFSIHKALGEVGIPYFIATKMDGEGSHEVVHTQLGGFNGAGSFLELILDTYGFKGKGLPSTKNNLAVSLPK